MGKFDQESLFECFNIQTVILNNIYMEYKRYFVNKYSRNFNLRYAMFVLQTSEIAV